MKKSVIALTVVTMFLLGGCNSSSSATVASAAPTPTPAPDLTGTWKADPTDAGNYSEATITKDTIEISWVIENGKTTSLYWSGSYTAPTNNDEPYTWTSTADKTKTSKSMFASQDDTKDFSYEAGIISFKASMLGVTTTVELKKADSSSATASATTEPAKKDLADGNYSDMGAGTFYITTPSGTSENGNVPLVYIDSKTSMYQIGYVGKDMNGGSLSYIYVDGILNDKEQIANSQGSITVKKDALTVGVHKVEIVQYTNDDTSSSMTCYKSASYEIKSK
jgi:uncharacterized lipoprotein NlpE involved in copper resistance